MTGHDTWRNQIIEALVTEWMARSDSQVKGSPTEHCGALADAVMPILDAVLAQQAEDIAQELQQAAEDHERTIADIARVAEPRRTGISAGLRRAVPIARQHIADGAPDA